MKKSNVIIIVALLFVVSAVSDIYAIVGVGFHWGFDFSMSMDDVDAEKLNLPLPTLPSTVPSEVTANLPNVDFFRVSRTDWKASAINFGGKAYVDVIPFIETIELSCNFGLWQYNGALEYLDIGDADNLQAIAAGSDPQNYNKIDLTLANQGLDYIGLNGTPYAKLQLDATVRKTFLNLWLIKFSGGAGVSAHFATPLLTGSLVEEVLGNTTLSVEDLTALMDPGNKNSKAIVQKIIDEALSEPVFGAHIILGVKAKLPVVPVGIYIDGKYMIPFGKFDEAKNINGFGLLINAGISLSI